ncbi:MAG: hypothetical protein HUK21_12825 [Fibrobacteraceae bacterium]|nr:hypothetical protein [Fibrobacteraceae bacterium]
MEKEPHSSNSQHSGQESQNRATELAKTSDTTASARVKKMRGWLGVKGSGYVGHFDDGGGFVDYGDAPNGWNR